MIDNKNLKGHTQAVLCMIHVKWDKNYSTIASGSRDNTIKLWNMNTKSCIKTLKGHTSYVNCLKQGNL